jgi:hypothetical protein
MESLQSRLDLKKKVEQWADFTIEKFQKAIRKQGIGVSNDLVDSFTKQVITDRDEMVAMLIKFKFYGRLRDMGVGRGIKAFERSGNAADKRAARTGAKVSYVNRKPKKWYNKTKTAQLYRLREILGEDIGGEATSYINDTFNQMGVQNINI